VGEKRQALVHPVIDAGMVVGERLVTVRNAEFVQSPHEAASAIVQVELILLAAVDVERFWLDDSLPDLTRLTGRGESFRVV